MFMKDIRKKQMRLAVLMEITDKPKRNSEIIKGAESRLILDDEYNRLMKNGKQSIGNKELQFVLYYIKRDKLANVPDRGLYAESEITVKERLAAASEFIEYIDTEAKPDDTFILKTDTINEIRKLIKDSSSAVTATDKKQVEKKSDPVPTKNDKDKVQNIKAKKDIKSDSGLTVKSNKNIK